jgi:hypothetical protein
MVVKLSRTKKQKEEQYDSDKGRKIDFADGLTRLAGTQASRGTSLSRENEREGAPRITW